MLTEQQIKDIIEAALMMSQQSLSIKKLLALFDKVDQVNKAKILASVQQLVVEYASRGINLHQLANGYAFRTNKQYAKWLNKLHPNKPIRYSRAFWEILAIIIHRQPVTRAEIEEIRGVAVGANILRILLDNQWISSVGHKPVPGKPLLYATTEQFLNDFNLTDLEQLPPLAEARDEQQIAKELLEDKI